MGTIALGVGVIAIALGGFVGWAVAVELASAVIAPGQIKVLSNRKQVQHVDGGRIEALLVQDGDEVQAGDVLLRLDPIRARASYEILLGSRNSAGAIAARLRAERDEQPKIDFPSYLLTQRDDPKVQDIVKGQQTIFEARSSSTNGETEILGEQISQLKEEIAGMRAQVKSKESQLRLIREEHAAFRELYVKGLAPKTKILALEREAARLDGERSELLAQIARAGKSITETRMKIIQLRRTFREDVVAELRKTETELADIEERLVAAQSQLEQIEIRAPASGTVVGLAVHTVGGVVGPRETILEIVPTDDRLIIEAKTDPLSGDDVTQGLKADVRLVALDPRTTPTLTGTVEYVSADSFADERTGTSYYIVHVALAEDEIAQLGGQELQPGMPVEVMIRTGERTPLEYLVQPISRSLARAWREK
jgi:HlyD family type I secretion membrane fusion protein